MANQKVDIDELANVIGESFERYGELSAEAVREVVEQTAKDTVERLKQTSPKEYGNYAESWTYDKNALKGGKLRSHTVVFNKKHYRLTHLLEYGHDLVTKTGKKLDNRAEARPHIANVERIAIETLTRNIEAKLSEIGL